MTGSVPDQLEQAPDATFRIERELGGGGMSRVYLAVDRELGRRIVVKVLPPELLTDQSLERFRREIRIAANLRHTNIVPVLTAGRAGSLVWYTMPFVDGESLRQRLTRAKRDNALIPIPEVRDILRQLARALAYAHRTGIVHRDIKPENILLAEDGVLVTDFGIAKALSDAMAESAPQFPTGPGIFFGTPAYVAPEQALDVASSDHRADIYSFGTVAYEMLSGAPPFAGRSIAEIVTARVMPTFEPLAARRPDAPADLVALVESCLQRLPADRPPSADAIVAALERERPGPSAGAWAASQRRRRRVVGVVAGAGIIALGVAGASLLTPDGPLEANRFSIDRFENRTGSETFDWLSDALPARVRDAITAKIAGLEIVEAGASGVGKRISGYVVRDGDSLVVYSELRDLRLNSVQPIHPVASHVQAAKTLTDTVPEKFVAAVTLLIDTTVTAPAGAFSTPATREAGIEMHLGIEAYFADDTSAATHYRRAAEADTMYVTPFVFAAYVAGWNGRTEELDTALARAERLKDRMTATERALYDYCVAMRAANLDRMLEAAQRFSAGMQGTLESPLLESSTALGLHDVAVAAAAIERAHPRQTLNRITPYYWLSKLGLEQERRDRSALLDAARKAQAAFPDWIEFRAYEIRELARSGAVGDLAPIIEGARLRRKDASAARLVAASQAATALAMNGRNAEAKALAVDWVARARALRADTSRWVQQAVAEILVAAEAWEALTALPGSYSASIGKPWYDRISYAAVGRIHLGDTTAAHRALRVLERDHPRSLDFGYRELAQARVLAHLGEHQAAIGLLEQAVREGIRLKLPWGADFRTDGFLAPLQAHPQFIALSPP